MNENSKKEDSLFIKEIHGLNVSKQNDDKSKKQNSVKINYLSVPSPDMIFPLHRNNSLTKRRKETNDKSSHFLTNESDSSGQQTLTVIPNKNRAFSGRNLLEKQKSVNEDAIVKSIKILSATNSDSKDYSSDESLSSVKDSSNYAINNKKNQPVKQPQNNIAIVISPLSDDDDDTDEEIIQKKENESQIDLSIFELLDHSSKKFILKPATMGLTIKSQVFRQKGLYPEYKFYLENLTDNLLLVMTARKRKKTKTTCYIINYISYDQTDVEKFIETPIAKLKSNLIGTQFLLYDFGIKPSKINENKHLLAVTNPEQEQNDTSNSYHNNHILKANSFDTNCSSENGSNDIQLLSSLRKEYLSISYELNFFGYKGPRQMFIIIPGMDNEFNREDFVVKSNSDSLLNSWKILNTEQKNQPESGSLKARSSSMRKRSSFTSQNSKKSSNEDANSKEHNNNSKINVVKLVNKSPIWHEQYKSFALNFNGRVTLPSVKNFQIVHEVNPDYIVSQFGKVDTDLYTCDYSYPLCALQAFSIALSSLDNKFGCD